jgi:hypothetical protein
MIIYIYIYFESQRRIKTCMSKLRIILLMTVSLCIATQFDMSLVSNWSSKMNFMTTIQVIEEMPTVPPSFQC